MIYPVPPFISGTAPRDPVATASQAAPRCSTTTLKEVTFECRSRTSAFTEQYAQPVHQDHHERRAEDLNLNRSSRSNRVPSGGGHPTHMTLQEIPISPPGMGGDRDDPSDAPNKGSVRRKLHQLFSCQRDIVQQVDHEGIEPSSQACKARVLPIELTAHLLPRREEDLNPSRSSRPIRFRGGPRHPTGISLQLLHPTTKRHPRELPSPNQLHHGWCGTRTHLRLTPSSPLSRRPSTPSPDHPTSLLDTIGMKLRHSQTSHSSKLPI